MEPEHGMRAMQGINEAAVGAPLMTLMFGTAVVAIALGATTLLTEQPIAGHSWMLIGLAIYFVGVVVVTIVGNVPMNDALAAMSASDLKGHAYWGTYLSHWTLINHLRTVTSAVAAIAFFVAYLKS